jgi:hypothetical protein
MSKREAIDTIRGYFYQFDKTMLEILRLPREHDSICVEGVEDIDIESAGELQAIQCKYYAGTEYNHSVIKPAICWMLRHFKANDCKPVKYMLYGHYSSGQHKLGEIDIDFLKENFLTTKRTVTVDGVKSKVVDELHVELSVTDAELLAFIGCLTVDINAPSFEDQYDSLILELTSVLKVGKEEVELFHYNAGLKAVRELSIQHDRLKRVIKKGDFLSAVGVRLELFDAWFIRSKGRDQYIRLVRTKRLARDLNTDPYDRFFLVDAREEVDVSKLQDLVRTVASAWGKVFSRGKGVGSYCPALYFHGLAVDKLYELKNSLYKGGYKFVDGYPFEGAVINSESFYLAPTVSNEIKLRIVNSLEDLDKLIVVPGRVVELYQFYGAEIFYRNDKVSSMDIKVESFDYVRDILK